jgi:DNA-binding CsgD family transcriptional regulator
MLFDYEWQFLLQMVTRIYYCETYRDTCVTILQQMKTLVPFQTGIIFRTGREDGRVTLDNPISTSDGGDDATGHEFFMQGNYPHWNEFVMSPYSSVFRQSDLIPPAKWERTRVYRDVWQPKNMFWGLFISLVHKDCPLAIIGLQREKARDDFSPRDIYVMNTLKDPLERKYYSLLENKHGAAGNAIYTDRIIKTAAEFNLTKRETEIVALMCSGKSGEDACQQLFITHATLSKHLSNIYAKTHVRNRTQLYGLFNQS